MEGDEELSFLIMRKCTIMFEGWVAKKGITKEEGRPFLLTKVVCKNFVCKQKKKVSGRGEVCALESQLMESFEILSD